MSPKMLGIVAFAATAGVFVGIGSCTLVFLPMLSKQVSEVQLVGRWRSDFGTYLEFTDTGLVRCVESDGHTIGFTGQYRVIDSKHFEVSYSMKVEQFEFTVNENELSFSDTFKLGQSMGEKPIRFRRLK